MILVMERRATNMWWRKILLPMDSSMMETNRWQKIILYCFICFVMGPRAYMLVGVASGLHLLAYCNQAQQSWACFVTHHQWCPSGSHNTWWGHVLHKVQVYHFQNLHLVFVNVALHGMGTIASDPLFLGVVNLCFGGYNICPTSLRKQKNTRI